MGAALEVLVVDDDDAMRTGFATFLRRHDDFEVVGECGNGAEAVQQYRELAPDVVLMDLRMPVMDGIEATRLICEDAPDAVIVALTTFDTEPHVLAALRAGAAGYLLKTCGGPALIQGLHDAVNGEMPLSPEVRKALVASVTGQTASATVEVTPRESELLSLLGQGMSNAQIARRMSISESSVKQYLHRIGGKLQASSRTQILVRAIQLNLVDPYQRSADQT